MLMTGLFVVTTGALLGMAWLAFNTAKVNGPMYGEIVQGKDLVADILPPPEYILETYLNVHLLLAEKDAAQQSLLVDKLKALRDDFNDRFQHWQTNLPAGKMRQCLVNEVAPPAKEFYESSKLRYCPRFAQGKAKMPGRSSTGNSSRFTRHIARRSTNWPNLRIG